MLDTSVLLAMALLLTALPAFAQGGDRISGRPFATRSQVIAREGMAATSQPLATQVALDILKSGGSAVDAAIAANAALGVMEPTGCGIGGDLFAIVWDADRKQLAGLNASGRSPYGLSRQYLLDQGLEEIPQHGPLPISVPGCVDGWFELHARYGRLPMEQVLAPAIGYAREGFPVSELIAYYWERSEKLRDHEGFAETFLPGGRAPREGEIFRNPRLADTLEAIARGGRDVFYRGVQAEIMDAFMQRAGGFLRKRDLAEHHSEWVDPVSTRYREYDVWELPPNGQGVAVLQMLNVLEGFDLRAMGHNSADYLHVMLETKKLVYEDRARFYADPGFAAIPLAELLSKEYAAQRRALIRMNRAADEYAPGRLAVADARLQSGDTIYLATADRDRNMVSLIQSNYRGFGSGLCPDGLGFCFQNRGEMFSLEAGHRNVYEPHKRPFHTIIPAFLTRDGRPVLAFGVMGGDMQPQGHVQIICNIVDFGMNLQEAGDAARWYHTGSTEPTAAPDAGRGVMRSGGVVALESGIAEAVRVALARRGHRIQPLVGPFGGYQAIGYDAEQDVYRGASESRKDGQAAGY